MTGRETDADAAEAARNELIAGQQAYWSGKPFDLDGSDVWRCGWLGAATESQRNLTDVRALVDCLPDIRSALEESHAAIRQLLPVKSTPRQRELATRAIDLITSVLPKLSSSAAGATPRAAMSTSSAPRARGGKRSGRRA